jgi:uncharacterized protein DUF1844
MEQEKKDSGFKVSDRRLFTPDGERRSEVAEEEIPVPPKPAVPANTATDPPAQDMPAPPTASEQQAQHDAYKQSSRDLDSRVELSGHSAQDLEVTFERFLASIYMTAMLQLGLMHEQGGTPQIDLIGARHTIDTIGMLTEKTKNNLSAKEKAFLDNILYELRMAYVEVTNALAHPPEQPGPSTGTAG